MSDDQKPDWVPEGAGSEFATKIVKGIGEVQTNSPIRSTIKRAKLKKSDYVAGILEGNLTILARAITLIESNAKKHFELAQEVLGEILPHTGKSTRIGITGVPGVGKSTFIENFGAHICAKGHKLAVLAVDPSSSLTRGSILGDKTRMAELSKNPRCFIRPSPSAGTLGGVHRKTRETILVCEAAGFDCILVETVGVGQSEISVRSMVDFFLLMMLAGAGDELQGIKKGVIELADAIIFHKADGDNKLLSETAKSECNRILHYLPPYTPGWKVKAEICSSFTGEGIPEVWEKILRFCEITQKQELFAKRRTEQQGEWLKFLVEEKILQNFYHHPKVQSILPTLEKEIQQGSLVPTKAAQQLLEHFYQGPLE